VRIKGRARTRIRGARLNALGLKISSIADVTPVPTRLQAAEKRRI